MKNNIKALIVGAGIIGERHAKAQKKLGSDVGIYNNTFSVAEKLAQMIGGIAFKDLDEAIAWSDIIHICTPDHLHTEIAIKAIEAGKHILCEKPLVTNLKDALQIQTALDKSTSKLLVGNNYRLTPSFLEIQKRVKKGKIGKILSIQTTYLHDMRSYYKKTPWRSDQNFLYGGGIHAIDLACWIAGEKVTNVQAITGSKFIKGFNHPEDYRINLTFASGFTAHVWLSARVVLPIHKTDVEVYGEKGAYIANNKSGVLRAFYHKQKKKEFVAETFKVGYRLTIPKEIEIANRYFTGKSKSYWPLVDIHEAVKEIKILEAIEKSIKSESTEKITA